MAIETTPSGSGGNSGGGGGGANNNGGNAAGPGQGGGGGPGGGGKKLDNSILFDAFTQTVTGPQPNQFWNVDYPTLRPEDLVLVVKGSEHGAYNMGTGGGGGGKGG